MMKAERIADPTDMKGADCTRITTLSAVSVLPEYAENLGSPWEKKAGQPYLTIVLQR